MSLRLISWNVNGLRAILKKNFLDVIRDEKPDIICLQETRCSVKNSERISIPGFKSFFNESKMSDARSADRYSGTVVFYRENMKVTEMP